MKLHESRMGLLTAAAAVLGLVLTVSTQVWAAPNATNECSIKLLTAGSSFNRTIFKLVAQACLQGDAAVNADQLQNAADRFANAWNTAVADGGGACIEDDGGIAESAISTTAAEEFNDASGIAALGLGACVPNGDLHPFANEFDLS